MTNMTPDRKSEHLLFRVYHKTIGGHVHVRIFSGVPGHTFQQNGTLVFDDGGADWKLFEQLTNVPGFIFIMEPGE